MSFQQAKEEVLSTKTVNGRFALALTATLALGGCGNWRYDDGDKDRRCITERVQSKGKTSELV